MSPKNGNKNNNKGFNWGRFSKTLSFWVFILLIPVVLIQLAGPRSEATTEINYTEYRAQLAANNIKDVTVSAGKNITGTFRQATVVGQKTHNGLEFPQDYPPGVDPEQLFHHDQNLRNDFINIGAGLDYQLDERYVAFANIGRSVWGENTHLIDYAITVGISRGF